METAETFIVIQGPRGSGKRELVVDQALKGRKNNVIIDCKPIQEARGDSNTIYAAALEVGYRYVSLASTAFISRREHISAIALAICQRLCPQTI